MTDLSDLSVIDSILLNLASVQSLYQFEYDQLATFCRLMGQFQEAKLKTPELQKRSDIFQKEYKTDIGFYQDRMKWLEGKIQALTKEIESRKQAKQKLTELFKSLQSLDSMDSSHVEEQPNPDGLPIMDIKEELDEDGNVINSTVKPYNESTNEAFSALGKAMDGMKEKDDAEAEAKVVSEKKVEAVPKASKSTKATPKTAKAAPKTTKSDPKKVTPAPSKKASVQDSDFHPYSIREEIDEDGNIVRSSVRKIPVLTKKEELKGGDGEVDDDQLSELLHDMDLKRPKIEELDEEEEKDVKVKEDVKKAAKIEEVKEKEVGKTTTNDKPDYKTVQKNIDSSMYTPEIDPEDLLTLEMIADDVSNDDDAKDDDDDDDEEEDLDVDGNTGITSLVPPSSRDLLFQKVQQLRIERMKKDGKDEPEKVAEGKVAETTDTSKKSSSLKTEKKLKKKKSVSFADDVSVKEVEDIWDDLREAERQGGHPKVSRFKVLMEGESVLEKEKARKEKESKQKKQRSSGFVVSDVMEHSESEPVGSTPGLGRKDLFDESVAELMSDEVAIKDRLKPEKGMLKLGGKKKPSKARLEHVAKMGLAYQKKSGSTPPVVSASVPKSKPKTTGSLMKKDFKSLRPPRKITVRPAASSTQTIATPKDTNPLKAEGRLDDEDFELIREEQSDGDPDDENRQLTEDYEVVEKKKGLADNVTLESALEKAKETERPIELTPEQAAKLEKHMKNATLDYRSLGDDDDTMARAYAMGLYDDDIDDSRGYVIENVEDFKTHNESIEKHGGEPEEEEEEEDTQPLLGSKVVEREVEKPGDENDPMDFELGPDNLNAAVALDYARMRETMVEKYGGGFTAEQGNKEFEPLDEVPRVSRFKAARLGRTK